MKQPCLWLGVFGVAASIWTARAQAFAIDWFSTDGGGGTGTGGVYSVNGTVSQPDAGALSGGSFAVSGGFWSPVAAVQTPGVPRLSVLQSNGVVKVFWEKPATGFFLDQATALGNTAAATAWSPVPPPYQTNGTHAFITVPVSAGNKLYRLRKP